MEGSMADAVIANRGLNFASPYGGYGYGHGNFQGDGSAVKEAVRGNRDISLLDSVNRSTTDQFMSQQIRAGDENLANSITSGNQFLTDRIAALGFDAKFAQITADFASAERLAFANKADTDRELKAIQLKQVECCCETKAGLAAIEAKLDADRASAAEAEVNNLRLQLNIVNQGRGNQGGN